MVDTAAAGAIRGPPLIRMSRTAAIEVVAAILMAFAIASGLALLTARQSQLAIIQQMVSATASVTDDLDREIGAARDLLISLSTSPALEAGDLKAFYKQMMETPKPAGSWLVLWDNDRQLLNTLRPYGVSLPTIADFPGAAAAVQKLHHSKSRVYIADRTMGLVGGIKVASLHIRIEDARGEMKGFISAALPASQLESLLKQQRLPPGWTCAIFDRAGRPISTQDDGSFDPHGLAIARALIKSKTASSGYFTVPHQGGTREAVSFSRAEESGYLVVTKTMAADVKAPFQRALFQIELTGILLLLAAALGFVIISRQAAIPLNVLSNRMAAVESSLITNNEHLRTIMGGISDCYLTVDADFRITEINATACGWLRVEESHVAGVSLWRIVSRETETSKAILHSMLAKRPAHLEAASGLRPGRWVDFRVYPSATGASIFFRDVTKWRQALERAERSTALIQSILDCVPTPIAVVNVAGRVVLSNRGWGSWVGNRANRLRIRNPHGPWSTTIFGDASVDIELYMRDVLSGHRSSHHVAFKRSTGAYRLSAAGFRLNGEDMAAVAIEDVTEAISAREEIERLSHSLLTVQECERRRIAEELHDSTAQHMVAVSLSVLRLRQLDLRASVAPICDQIAFSADEALREIRSFSYLLHPPSLEADGLEGSIRAFTAGVAVRTGLTISVRWNSGNGLTYPFEVQRTLFRVVQEALMNIYRHADATRVVICASTRGRSFSVRIWDNGHGMADQAGPKASSFGIGIPGMRSRLASIGGDLCILTGGRGTLIVASLPAPLGAPVAEMLSSAA